MSADDPAPGALRPDGGSAFDQYGMEARVEARMLDPDKSITDEQRQALIREIQNYRDNHKTPAGKPLPWAELGAKIGVSGPSLSEITNGKYKADPSHFLRKIDQFLADERIRTGRFDARSFARINVTQKIKGAINHGLKHNTIPVIIGEPGSGKSAHARWFVGQRPGAVLIEPDDADCDGTWVIDAVYKALGIFARNRVHRRDRKRAIVSYLQKHKNTVIVCDECQGLRRSALEMLRRFHDLSDPQGMRNVSVVLFGDEDFYKLIVRTRGGARTPISPQVTRRMYPIFDVMADGCDKDADGNVIDGTVFKRSCIEAITRNQRLRVLKGPEEIAWLTKLANTHRFGSLGLAMRVFEVAWDLRDGKYVTVNELVLTLPTVISPAEAELADVQTGHELLLGQSALAG